MANPAAGTITDTTPTGPAEGEGTPSPLDALHRRLGAQMDTVAGRAVPRAYPGGPEAEHAAAREAAALFDLAHLGRIALTPRGDMAAAARAIERLVPADIVGLAEGRQRHALLTDGRGGILDDMMIAHRGDHFLATVAAATRDADLQHFETLLADAVRVAPRTGEAMLSLQGPEAAAVLATLAPGAEALAFMDVAEVPLAGARAVIARAGATGEDGFEIAVPADAAEAVAEALLADPRVSPAGLAAAESLRLEAGICRHGRDIDATTSPVEAGLAACVGQSRRPGGAREGGFPGAARILAELAAGPSRLRAGLRPEGGVAPEPGASLFESRAAGDPVGQVTSSGPGPTVGGPVAMGYLPPSLAVPGAQVFAETAEGRLPCAVVDLPFVPPARHRGRADA